MALVVKSDILKLPFIVAAVLLFGNAKVLADPNEEIGIGHILFESHKDNDLTYLLDALTETIKKPTRTPTSIIVEDVPRELSEPWRGNAPQLLASVSEVGITFGPKAPMNPGDESRQTFEIFLAIEKESLIVRHSQPKERRFEGGIRVSIREKKTRKFYLEGANGTGVVVFVPGELTTNPLVLLLCPRVLEVKKSGSHSSVKQVLKPSGFEMEDAKFKVAGSVKGKVLTGVGMGKAKVQILTTPNIPRSVEFEDEVNAKDPSLDLDYRSFQQDKISSSIEADELIGGIEVGFVGHKPSGFKRVTSLREGMWLNRFSLERPLSLVISRAEVPVEQGSCVSVVREKKETVIYSQDPIS